MCLLTFIQEYATPTYEHLQNSAINNPDGFGYAIHDRTRIISNSGLNADKIISEFFEQREKYQGVALFHSRITTHGGTTVDNCHPFRLGNDQLSVVGHNGMLPIKERNGKSDTRIFAEELFPSWGGASTLNSKKARKKLAKFATGSKLVFLSANPAVQNDYTIINEDLGSWDGDIWWSNNSYKYGRTSYSYSGSGMYTSGWSTSAWKPVTKTDEFACANSHNTDLVEDCTYIDENGEEIWGELWTCSQCGHKEYVCEANVNQAELCPECDTCWFCHNDRMMCSCLWTPSHISPPNDWYNEAKIAQKYVDDSQRALTVGNYDSTYDYHY